MSLISRYVSDPSEALDVAQEAFIKAYRAIGKFRGDSAFYTWLYRIAINTAKNWLVARNRRPPASDIDAVEAEQYDMDSRLKERMECPIGTVRSRIFRAREAIDEKLKQLVDGQ